MARLYARKRGKSGSTKPVSKKPPVWCKYEPEEVEAMVVRLAREGNSPSAIGGIMRDRYGVPLIKLVTGKTVSEILKASGLSSKMPEDLESLLRKTGELRKHYEKNRKDYTNKRALALLESKIHRLAKYYRERGVLQPDWEYKPVAASVA